MKQVLDLTKVNLTLRQLAEVIDIVFGQQDSDRKQELYHIIKYMECVSISEFCWIAIQRYQCDHSFYTRQTHDQKKKNDFTNIEDQPHKREDFEIPLDKLNGRNDMNEFIDQFESRAQVFRQTKTDHEPNRRSQAPDYPRSLNNFQSKHYTSGLPSQSNSLRYQVKSQDNSFLNEEEDFIDKLNTSQQRMSNENFKRIHSQEQEDNHSQKNYTQNGVQSNRFKLAKLKDFANDPLQEKVVELLEENISNFVEGMLAEIDDINEDKKNLCRQTIADKIQDVVACLLHSINKFDKMIWFKKLGNTQPDSTHLIYIENMQRTFRTFSKKKLQNITHEEINQLCTQIMQTPELAKQIGSALISFFEENL